MLYKAKDFLPFMKDISGYNTKLAALYDKWDNARLLCEMNCPVQSKSIVPKMVNIQNIFNELHNRLTTTLIAETLKKSSLSLDSTAQVAIDILMRNLFERTADVGFLATDDEIVHFVLDPTEQARTEIKERLQKYVAKYSVYHDVIILNTQLEVLANLDDKNEILGRIIQDDALEQIVHSSENYLEVFKETDLLNGQKGHVFLGRINSSDRLIGILCLCFRFENEMKRIFKAIGTEDSVNVVTILDDKNKVIASSDTNEIPIGIPLKPCNDINEIVYYRGVKYMSKTVETTGYQGYMGLEWRAHIMSPIHIAFDEKAGNFLNQVNQDIVTALLEDSYYFSPDLTDILKRTREVNHMLRRFVYNGQLMNSNDANSHEIESLKPLFRHIDKVGQMTKSYFDQAIKSLFGTIISSSLGDVRFLSSLCIDIMDRNLYERANDCRWWALNLTFKKTLAQNILTDEDKKKLTAILEYINSLYTVYDNLFIYDRTGRIVAVSNGRYMDNLDEVLHDRYVMNTLANGKEQDYFVSSFKASKQYKNRHTYIFSASIIYGGVTVGGIGIVFDGELQFQAMLEEALKTKENSFALFVDKKSNIIASTHPSLKMGSKWEFMQGRGIDFTEESSATLLSYDSAYYAMGYSRSKGYREYKNHDNYRNEVYAVVMEKMSQTAENFVAVQDAELLDAGIRAFREDEQVVQIAIFVVNGQFYAFDRNVVKDVIDPNIIDVPDASEWTRGVTLYNGQALIVINSGMLLGGTKSALGRHLLVVDTGEGHVAVEAGDLNNVLEVSRSSIVKIQDFHSSATHSLVEGVVSVGEDEQLNNIILLNNQSILDKVSKRVLDADLVKYQKYVKDHQDTENK